MPTRAIPRTAGTAEWTEETLAAYAAERTRAATKLIFRPKKLPTKQVGYNPQKWRR